MALPNSIDASTPGGTDSPALGDNQLRDLKTFLEDVFGIPDATSITAAAFSISSAGVVTVSQANTRMTSIELGHASDTTITRASAGIIAVEGVAVPTISSTDTLSNKTLATPIFTTSITGPLLIGGTAASSTLTLRSTSGVGTSDAIIFQVGNNGAVEAARFNTAGVFLVATTVATSAALGDVVIPNGRRLKSVNAAGDDTIDMMFLDTANIPTLFGNVKFNNAPTAMGGGATPTFGTIGGSGPTAAGQSMWLQLTDGAGNAFWVPGWR